MQQTIEEFHDKRGRGIGRFGDNLLLMTANGARSASEHTTPLLCRRRGDDYVVVASKGGAPGNPRWYRNIQVNPDVKIEVPVEGGTKILRARARVLPSGEERDELYAFMTEIWPDFANYQKRTERTIPVVVLTPVND